MQIWINEYAWNKTTQTNKKDHTNYEYNVIPGKSETRVGNSLERH